MGDVLEMRRKVEASVRRFGHHYKVEYRAGRNPSLTDPQAALYVDGAFFAWLSVGFHAHEWEGLYLDLDEDHVLVTPDVMGMSPTTEDTKDHRFLLETEEYIVSLLTGALVCVLADSAEVDEGEPTEVPDPRGLSPYERGCRVVSFWHDHGKDEAQLPALIAVEIYDAVEGTGLMLADALGEFMMDLANGREDGSGFIQAMTEDLLQGWHGGES